MLVSVIATQITALQGDGGKPFTAFVDALLRGHAAAHGVPDADVLTNIRTNIGDKGVDTEVIRPVPADGTGWLDTPTVWQYKGTAYTGTSTAGMIEGKHVRRRIPEGYAFRLAIADSMPAPTRAKWEQRLTTAVRKVRKDAPEARVVTADEMAAWASRYPGLALTFFHRAVAADLLHVDAWARNARRETREYVAVPGWAGARTALAAHADLSRPAPAAVQTLQAEAGVGKTRLVFEVVHALPGAQGLVVYAGEETAAVRAAFVLANEGDARAVLVADECGAVARQQLEAALGGHRDRVRVIAIDNTFVRRSVEAPELALENMSRETLEAVLARNFPEVADERRRAYADLAEGFPRLAVDLCRHDGRIGRAGDLAPVVPPVAEYLEVRLQGPQGPAQWDALAALSLVAKAGYAGDVKGELAALCEYLDLDRRTVEQALRALHDGPGFVARTSRYMYATPGIVARVAFEAAWRRWAARDPAHFLSGFPDVLLSSLEERVRRSAPEEVRRDYAAFFRDWAAGLAAEQLTDAPTVRRLEAVTETDPGTCLPLVRRLVEAADLDLLRGVRGDAAWGGGWGARRTLVWLAERLAQFPAYFDDAERVLARLAAAESEPSISNNATGVWRQFFRLYLSGTATPFDVRLARLRERLRSDLPEVRALARGALGEPFAWRASRTLGPAVVAGRIPPPDWRAATAAEQAAALRGALGLLHETLGWGAEARDAVVAVLAAHLRFILSGGYLDEAVRLAADAVLTDAERSRLLKQLDLVLAYDVEPREGRARAPEAYAARLRAWRDALVGGDLHGRLVAVVGRERWQSARFRSEAWDVEVGRLADALLAAPDALEAELPWLAGGEAHAAAELGDALGRRDADARLLDVLLATALAWPSHAFARGYVHGLLAADPSNADAVNAWIDVYEALAPAAAAEVAMSGGRATHALGRALALFDAGRLPATYLYDANFATGRDELPVGDLLALLGRLATAAEGGDAVALRVGLDALGRRLPYEDGPAADPLLADHPALTAVAWRLLDAAGDGTPAQAVWWGSVLAHLGRLAPDRAARYAARVMAEGTLDTEGEAGRVLLGVADSHADAVMAALGAVMLDERVGWKFMVGDVSALVDALPSAVVRAWIERAGVEGARRVARHLPAPRIDEGGEPAVPELTAWTLATFEDDDRTFDEFAAGTHSFDWYSGDIAAQHEQEAAVARRFLDHPLRRVREWARLEEQSATENARRTRIREEESNLP